MPVAVGIDIGNFKCVVAISNDGVVDVVLNEETARETPTIVHFDHNHRLFGVAAAHCATSNPSCSISQLKRLVGLSFKGRNFQNERLRLPYQTSEGTDGGITITVPYFDTDAQVFTAVEVLAMLFAHLKRMAEKAAGAELSGCVIGVPAYFSTQQSKAFFEAAWIAGWNPLEIFEEGRATAEVYRDNRSQAVKTVAVVVFVDVGDCDTQVTVVRFQGHEIKVLGEEADRNLGGRDFDEILYQHLVDRLRQQCGIDDIHYSAKVKMRMRMACEKAKKVLTANKDALIDVETFMDGVDVNVRITRDEFEGLSSGLLRRIKNLFLEALKKSLVGVCQLHSVELVGSGSRIPAISRTLVGVFGKGLSRTLNGSECVACGCALRCEKLLYFKKNTEARKLGTIEVRMGKFSVFDAAGNTRTHLSKAVRQERRLQEQDEIIKRAKERRNVFELRKSKSGSADPAMGPILSKLDEIQKWLYKEGAEQQEDVYEDTIRELNMLQFPARYDFNPPLGHDRHDRRNDDEEMFNSSNCEDAKSRRGPQLLDTREIFDGSTDSEAGKPPRGPQLLDTREILGEQTLRGPQLVDVGRIFDGSASTSEILPRRPQLVDTRDIYGAQTLRRP